MVLWGLPLQMRQNMFCQFQTEVFRCWRVEFVAAVDGVPLNSTRRVGRSLNVAKYLSGGEGKGAKRGTI